MLNGAPIINDFIFYIHLTFRFIYHSSAPVDISLQVFTVTLFSCSKNLYAWLLPPGIEYPHLAFTDTHGSPSSTLSLPFQSFFSIFFVPYTTVRANKLCPITCFSLWGTCAMACVVLCLGSTPTVTLCLPQGFIQLPPLP